MSFPVEIYIDGSCLGNSSTRVTPGGAGVVIKVSENKIIQSSISIPDTTNDRAELKAFLLALDIIKTKFNTKQIIIYSDSRYVLDGVTIWLHNWKRNGWKRGNGKPVKNADLWKEVAIFPRLSELTMKWVKGHSGNKMNEMADKLAHSAAKQGL